jgi:O-antigen/teichoic acid export membrane protein
MQLPSFIPAFIRNIFVLFPKITKDIFIYGLGGSLAQIVGLITIPIITRLLSATEYGSVDIVNASTGYFAALISLNISTGLMRHFFEVPEADLAEKQKLVSSLIWFTVLFGGFIALIGSAFSSSLSNFLFSSTKYAVAFSLAIVSLPLTALNKVFFSIFRMERRPVTYLSINILYAIINFLLILLFVIPFDLHVTGVFAAQLVASAVIAALGAWLCRKYIRIAFSKKWFFSMAAYGIPLLPGSMFNWGMLTVNRILLTQYVSANQIAYYSVATKASKIIELAVSAFTLAWQPFYLANINSPTFHDKLDKALRYYVYACLLLSAVVTVYAKEFFGILAPPEYQAGVILVPLLCLRIAFSGANYITGVGIVKEKKTFLSSAALGIGVLATIGSSLILIPTFGILGAAIGDLIGQIVFIIVYEFFSYNLYKMTWKLKPILLALAGFFMLYFFSNRITFENLACDFLFRSGLMVAFFVFIAVVVDQGKMILSMRHAILKK